MKPEDGGSERQPQLKRNRGNLVQEMSSSLLCNFSLIVLSLEELGSLGESPPDCSPPVCRYAGAQLAPFANAAHSEKCQI